MGITITKNYSTLTVRERKAVEKRLARNEAGEATETVEQFLDKVNATNETLAEYLRQDEVEDKQKWARVVDVAFQLSAESRLQLVTLVMQRAAAENIDTSGISLE